MRWTRSKDSIADVCQGRLRVQVVDGLITMANTRDPEDRFVFTRAQALSFASIFEPAAPDLAQALREASKLCRDYAARKSDPSANMLGAV